jgi:hypothetical protein
MENEQINRGEPAPDSTQPSPSVLPDRCYIDLEALNQEKRKRDQLFQDRVERIHQEKAENDLRYEERVAQIRQQEQYKTDIFQANINQLLEKKALQDRMFQEKVDAVRQEHTVYNRTYEEKLLQVHQIEAEKERIRQEEIARVEQERMGREREIQDKIDHLQAEMQKMNSHFQNRIVRLSQDQEYKQEVVLMKNDLQHHQSTELQQFEETIVALQQEKEQQDSVLNEELARLHRELADKELGIQAKIDQVLQEKRVQDELMESRMARIELEKDKQEEMFRLAEEKIQNDQVYREKFKQLSQEQQVINREHKELQHELAQKRESMEALGHKNLYADRIGFLKPLKQMKEYEVAEKGMDIRGWKVMGRDREVIGEIEDLIVDTSAMKVRYLDIDVDNELLEGQDGRHVLIPIGLANLDSEGDEVSIPTLDRTVIANCPAYDCESVTRDYEETLLSALSPGSGQPSSASPTDDFYRGDQFDADRFYNSRRER